MGLLTSLHGSTLVVRVSSRVTSGVSSLFVAESLLSRRNVPEGSSLVLELRLLSAVGSLVVERRLEGV